jgi:mannosyl-3-phosphoglycerate phosphatase
VLKNIESDPRVIRLFLQRIEEAGLRYTVGGRYYHVHGDNDKGRAVTSLNRLFEKTCGPILTVGLGDSLNDLPLLKAVDLPVLVKKPDGHHDRAVIEQLPHVRRADKVGPQGWNTAVMEILAEIDPYQRPSQTP